jgi:hypothetical protein
MHASCDANSFLFLFFVEMVMQARSGCLFGPLAKLRSRPNRYMYRGTNPLRIERATRKIRAFVNNTHATMEQSPGMDGALYIGSRHVPHPLMHP